MVAHDTARVDNLHPVVKHQQTDGSRFKQVQVDKGVLKQLFQNGLRNFQLADGVK